MTISRPVLMAGDGLRSGELFGGEEKLSARQQWPERAVVLLTNI
jgi:hypothetical protein